MPPTITEAHPPLPLAEVTALIEAFPSMPNNEKKAAIDTLVTAHPTLNMNWGEGWRFRRCRKLDANYIPERVDQLIWRQGVPATLGRANPEGFQILYLADRQDTALCETRVSHAPVVIADFSIRTGCSIRVAPIGELVQVQRTGRGFLSGDVSHTMNGMLNACPLEEAQSLLITDAFLLDCFVGHDDYDLSSHVAIAIFNKNKNIDAIAYPSRRQLGAINFAVRVENFWDTWGLVSVSYGEAKHLAMGYFDMKASHAVSGIYTDGRLKWVDIDNPNERLLLDPPFTPSVE